MNAILQPFMLKGAIDAPPSKSMAHRYLVGSALSGSECLISGVDFSEDISASIDCLKALGAEIDCQGDVVTINPDRFMKASNPTLNCRESGSTLRFFIPLALCMGTPVTLTGSKRLFERPLDIYEDLCREQGFTFEKGEDSLTLCGNLKKGTYKIRGDISSQFITGLIFALVYLGGDSAIEIIPPFESRPYVDLTLSALAFFGAKAEFSSPYTITIGKSDLHSYSGRIEGDYSNGAFLDAFNHIGSEVKVGNLYPASLQGDKVYKEYFDKISNGTPTLDISNCPDLGPVLIALASLKNGATFTGTDRLKSKESDRGRAMAEELGKLGVALTFGDNMITVPKADLEYKGIVLDGHNDHRIVMALTLVLSTIGGEISGVEAVRKSYPGFFDDICSLGAKVNFK